MGTIIYQNLVELLLEEGDKTKEEIIKESIKRFGFIDDEILEGKIIIALTIETAFNNILKVGERYFISKRYSDNRERFLKEFSNMPDDSNYFKERPYILKLKQALEK